MSESKFLPEKSYFPFSECVFYGFEASKGHGRELIRAIVLPAGGLLFLLYAASFYMLGQFLPQIKAMNAPGVEVGEIFAAIGNILGMYGILFVVSLLIMASSFNAAYRWFLNRELSGQLGALRFGMDELRTVGVAIVYGLLVFLVPYLAMILLMIVGVALSALGTGGAIIGGLVMFIGVIGLIASMVYLSVKLSLCVPLSLERQKFTMFDSMRLTKKRGWALLGSYVIMGLIYMVAIMILSTLQNIMLMGQMMPLLTDPDMMNGDSTAMFQAMADMFTSPATLAALAILVILQTIVGLVFLFGYTGLTTFSMRFLQEEKGDIVANLDVFD